MIILGILIAVVVALFFIWFSGSWKNEPWPHPEPGKDNPYRYWER